MARQLLDSLCKKFLVEADLKFEVETKKTSGLLNLSGDIFDYDISVIVRLIKSIVRESSNVVIDFSEVTSITPGNFSTIQDFCEKEKDNAKIEIKGITKKTDGGDHV